MISYTEMTPGISLDIIAYISSCLRLTEAMEHYISVMPNYLKKKEYIYTKWCISNFISREATVFKNEEIVK